MSFVRTNQLGEPVGKESPDNPIVIDAGIPGFRATIPLTTPARQQLATYAVLGVGFVGFLAVAGALAYASRKSKSK